MHDGHVAPRPLAVAPTVCGTWGFIASTRCARGDRDQTPCQGFRKVAREPPRGMDGPTNETHDRTEAIRRHVANEMQARHRTFEIGGKHRLMLESADPCPHLATEKTKPT